MAGSRLKSSNGTGSELIIDRLLSVSLLREALHSTFMALSSEKTHSSFPLDTGRAKKS